MGSEYIQNMKGNKNFAIGELLGVSEKTVERANFVNKNASEDQKQAIKAGEATVNSTCDDIKAEKKKAKQQIAVEDDSDFSNTESSDDISEALGDNSRTPSGLNFNHSDGIERPTNKLSSAEDSARTSERRSAYESGFVDGFKQAAAYIFFQVKKDKFIEEIEKEFDGAKKTFAKLSSFVPKEIEIPEEEYDGKELTFDDSNENEAFDLGIDEEQKMTNEEIKDNLKKLFDCKTDFTVMNGTCGKSKRLDNHVCGANSVQLKAEKPSLC